ncbi:MAG: hypothetical protein ACXABO_11985 [Promethearchaeota archaeon]
MNVRECFRCGKKLDYESFIKNASPHDTEALMNLWNSDYIEFFCCRCYSFKMKFQPTIDGNEFSYY